MDCVQVTVSAAEDMAAVEFPRLVETHDSPYHTCAVSPPGTNCAPLLWLSSKVMWRSSSLPVGDIMQVTCGAVVAVSGWSTTSSQSSSTLTMLTSWAKVPFGNSVSAIPARARYKLRRQIQDMRIDIETFLFGECRRE